MKIRITEVADNTIKAKVIGKNCIKVGHDYYIESAFHGTLAQNRFFHLLLAEYFNSGLYSYDAKNVAELKNSIKKSLGQGFESYLYIDDNAKFVETKRYEKIPKHIVSDRTRVRGRLKSWGDYTKNQRQTCIDNLITEMITVGVNSKKFDSILEEMNEQN